MAPIWLWFRADLRRRWRSWLGVMLLIGLTGAVVIASLTGARRSDTAYTRFLDVTDPVA